VGQAASSTASPRFRCSSGVVGPCLVATMKIQAQLRWLCQKGILMTKGEFPHFHTVEFGSIVASPQGVDGNAPGIPETHTYRECPSLADTLSFPYTQEYRPPPTTSGQPSPPTTAHHHAGFPIPIIINHCPVHCPLLHEERPATYSSTLYKPCSICYICTGSTVSSLYKYLYTLTQYPLLVVPL
jgi:hypothetical protein